MHIQTKLIHGGISEDPQQELSVYLFIKHPLIGKMASASLNNMNIQDLVILLVLHWKN